ncbi:ferredoxin [Jatrophihabitans endophyticus]|uniref:Ferredoxin n=1 Tax=Jatrophihabitans endophyticus TaxID=1206085 RepID=A0A1M5PS53_9ACTN|nr:ferredoxin [Jatrophihabitans endophyticus]SHH04349.1 ferredoxin [Jatrophihabitans endophyticus]
MAEIRVFAVDTEICAGHGRCYALAPESFEPDDSGYAEPTGRDESGRPQTEIDQIIGTCPEEAISVASAPVASEA